MLFVVVTVLAGTFTIDIAQNTRLEALAIELQALRTRAVAPLLLLVGCIVLVILRR